MTIFSELTSCEEVQFRSVVDYFHVNLNSDFNFRNWSIRKSKKRGEASIKHKHDLIHNTMRPRNDGHIWFRKRLRYEKA